MISFSKKRIFTKNMQKKKKNKKKIVKILKNKFEKINKKWDYLNVILYLLIVVVIKNT